MGQKRSDSFPRLPVFNQPIDLERFKRKGACQCAIYPYYVFGITYGNYSYAIEIPTNSDKNHSINDIPFPPIPFYAEKEQCIDLSSTERVNDLKQKIYLTSTGGLIEIDPAELPNDVIEKAIIK